MRKIWFATVLLMVLSVPAVSQTIRAGVAVGFPPYQYSDGGRPAGLDVELGEAIAREAGFRVEWLQDTWDNLTSLMRLTDSLDMLTGMERTGDREQHFLFTQVLYWRKNVLFVLETDRRVAKLEDLNGLAVARDRDSASDSALVSKGLKAGIRLVRTDSKEEAFSFMVGGKVAGVFMPEAVGWALARAKGVAVRAIDFGDTGSPVGLAFRPDGSGWASRMNAAVLTLDRRGDLKRILERYRSTKGSAGTP